MYPYNIKYTEEELSSEEEKLLRLLSNLTQAHRDREETIQLVIAQLDAVRQLKAFQYGPQTF